ncbi:hypothetical protein PDIDSM_2091 [Penicillium digitatum]|nr:hypothetical protein PDIDSM_2091 [Penicillium digitatum]
MQELTEHVRAEILSAQARYEEQTNRHRALPVDTEHPNPPPQKKLDWKNLGPFKVLEAISAHAYKLELPASMKIPLCLTSACYSLPPRTRFPLGTTRPRSPRLKYTVKWIGYDEPTEEPVEYLDHAREIIRNFHRRYPHKPRLDGARL